MISSFIFYRKDSTILLYSEMHVKLYCDCHMAAIRCIFMRSSVIKGLPCWDLTAKPGQVLVKALSCSQHFINTLFRGEHIVVVSNTAKFNEWTPLSSPTLPSSPISENHRGWLGFCYSKSLHALCMSHLQHWTLLMLICKVVFSKLLQTKLWEGWK